MDAGQLEKEKKIFGKSSFGAGDEVLEMTRGGGWVVVGDEKKARASGIESGRDCK